MKVSFIGLGVMGYPMAGHLVSAGFDVSVFNRTQAKAQAWAAQHGGRAAPTVEACVREADVVLMCVGNDDDVRSMATSEQGALAFMKPGAILVDHTTTSALLAEELGAAAQQAGVRFMDAPCPVVRRARKTAYSPSCAVAKRICLMHCSLYLTRMVVFRC